MTSVKVRRLPKDTGPAGWNALLPPADEPEPLETAVMADWIIIGAGFAGLAAAQRLRQIGPGERIIVLDAVRVGEGPAGRNSGFMIDLPHDLSSDNYGGSLDADRLQIAVNRSAIDFALSTASSFGMPAESIARSGKINAAATDKGLKHNADYARHLAALGEDYELLDAAAMRERTGSDYYLGGLYTPNAAMLQPAMFVRGVAEGLKLNGVSIHENTPVLDLTRDGGAWTATTPKGQVTAPKVILAVNGHAESFGFFRRRLAHVFTYASMTRELSLDEVRRLGGLPTWGATPADPMGTTVRRVSGAGGDRIVVRNRFTYDASMEISEMRIARIAGEHDRSFRARFPELKDVPMEYRWGGRLCLSLNNAPAFGEIEEGLFAACCQNGLGTAKGTFAGVAAADLAAGRNSTFTQMQLSAGTPSKLPPEPFAWLGATAQIRWKELRAGREL